MYKPKTANNMKKTVNKYEFTDTMTLNGFSRSGSLALFNWLEELEEDTQEQIEFDPIALRCDFTEYKNLEEIAQSRSGGRHRRLHRRTVHQRNQND